VLPVLAFGAGADDPPVLVPLHVDVPLPAGQRPAGELFDEAFGV
jgi:hypothetical protein